MGAPYKVLVLNSGGYDSTLLLHYFQSFGYEVWSLTFDYGQPDEELKYVRKNLELLELPFERQIFLKIPLDWGIGNLYDGHSAGAVGYIPMRNAIFLSYALSIGETIGMDAIGIGVLGSGDFADNHAHFVDDFQAIAGRCGMWIMSPLDQMDKEQVYKVGNKLGVEISDTWSCNTPEYIDGETTRCGLCNSCVSMKEAIKNKILVPKKELKFHS